MNNKSMNKEKSLKQAYQKLLDVGFGERSLEETSEFITKDVMGYGTAQDEKIMTLEEFNELIKNQRKQAVNFDDISFSSNPVKIKFLNNGNVALVVDEIEINTQIKNESNNLFLRMTTIFEYGNESWKLIHWHSSTADHVSGGEDPWHVEEWKQKTEKLERMVEEKTAELIRKNSELEIEAALERVRSIAMGMQKSDDLLNICEVSYNEFEKLGFDNLRAVLIHILDDEKRTFADYDYCGSFGGQISNLSYDSHPVVVNYFKQIKSREDAFAEAVLSGEELESWKKVRLETGQKDDPRLNATDALYYYGYSIGFGDFSISTLKPIDEVQINILKRFRNVFDLAYRRFIDIEKAEAQAKEAEIEVALERVRSRSMAMHTSDEFVDASDVMVNQLKELGINTLRIGIGIINKEDGSVEIWSKSEIKGKVKNTILGVVPRGIHPIFDNMVDAWKVKKSLYSSERVGDEVKEYYEKLDPCLSYPKRTEFNERETMTAFFFKHGSLNVISLEPLKEEDCNIMIRFAKVFGQIYQRFLDLQIAEAQAREATIEAALERVRSRSMGMQKSEELKEVIQVVYEQFINLNIDVDHAGFIIDYTPKGDWHFWIADEQYIPSKITHPYFESVWANQFNEAKEKGADFFATNLNFEEKNKFYKELLSYVPGLLEASKDFYLNCPGLAISTVLLENVGLYIENFSGIPYSDDENKILMRFGKVFQQTYTRFLDLQKAEAQAREAQIEAALERVRSKSMAMHKSDELADLSLELVKQVHTLGVDTWFCAFNIYDDDQQGSLEWGSNGQGTFPQYRTPREGIFLRYYEAGQRGEKLFVNEINEKDCSPHYEYLCSLPGVGEQLLKMKNAGIPFPTSQIDHVAYFRYGYIIFITFKPALEAHDIFKRFAGVFEQTYTRFLDLQKSEEQRKIIQAENDRKTEELEEARQLQLAMLPKELPKLSKLDIATYMRTATEVGGDYYDYSFKDNGSINICLGDATGHGLKAGTLVSMMKSLFVSESVRLDIDKFFVSANETLKKMSLNKMMIAFAMVNIHGNQIKISNAGIPPIYIFRKNLGIVEEVNLHGLPIGALKNSKYAVYQSELLSGDAILMLSDGMPELQNKNEQMYGYQKLAEVFEKSANKSADDIIRELENESKIWAGEREADDDITFVVIKIK